MAFSRVRIARTLTMGLSLLTDYNYQLPTPNRRFRFLGVLGIGSCSLLDPLGFLHPGGLALQVAQEVQLRAAHAGRTHDVDLGNRRRVQREDALHALAERHLADGE